jgi:NDP-sugar pyrophosphorylase family protein
MKLDAVIICGGLATRLYPQTKTIPKSMIQVAGKPFIYHQLDLLLSQNIRNVVICVGYLGDQIIDSVGEVYKNKIYIRYSDDGSNLLGTGGALLNALPKIKSENFFVLYGDSYPLAPLREVYEHYVKVEKSVLMTVYQNYNKWDKSNCIYQKGMVTLYDKKNYSNDMTYIDYGLSIISKEFYQKNNQISVFDLAEFYSKLSKKQELAGMIVSKRFYEIGSVKGIKEADDYLNKDNKK